MAQAALTQVSEAERYRILLEGITDYAIYLLDPEGRVSSWNAGAERFKGYQAHEIIGEHFSKFYAQEDLSVGQPEKVLKTAISDGRYEGEGWRIRKDGSRFWAHVIVDSIKGPAGEVLGFAKITRDLTEQKNAEDELKKSQEQFRLLVQGVTDYAIYMLDPQGHVISWNLGASRIKGYDSKEIIGQHFSKFYTVEDQSDGLPHRALETAKREGHFEHEGWRVRKDGTKFWATVVVDPIRDDDNILVGFAKVTRDITKKKEAEIALERAQEDLLQSRKMEALGLLAGGIAHDFNNLLMAISGSLELLQSRLEDDAQLHRLAGNALQGAQRGTALTSRLLAFSRKQTLKPQAVDIKDLLCEMDALLQLAVGDSVAIETRGTLIAPRAIADPSQLELALLNVVSNARDAMPRGGDLLIEVAVKEPEDLENTDGIPKSYICLSISDTGEGMDEDTISRAADPFFTTKELGKGTGLGLSVVHGLLSDLGGRLVLKSRKGHGTTVEMWLPAESEMPEEFEATTLSKDVVDEKCDTLTVLAVDDDVLVLMNTVMMLEDLGYQVLEASNGTDALKEIEGRRIDLLITDQKMPNMSGAELISCARRRQPDLPAILATGYSEVQIESEGESLLKLEKPFGIEQLRSVVRSAISSSSSTK